MFVAAPKLAKTSLWSLPRYKDEVSTHVRSLRNVERQMWHRQQREAPSVWISCEAHKKDWGSQPSLCAVPLTLNSPMLWPRNSLNVPQIEKAPRSSTMSNQHIDATHLRRQRHGTDSEPKMVPPTRHQWSFKTTGLEQFLSGIGTWLGAESWTFSTRWISRSAFAAQRKGWERIRSASKVPCTALRGPSFSLGLVKRYDEPFFGRQDHLGVKHNESLKIHEQVAEGTNPGKRLCPKLFTLSHPTNLPEFCWETDGSNSAKDFQTRKEASTSRQQVTYHYNFTAYL